MRERLRLNWQLETNTPVGLTAQWLLQQAIKDHALEAMLAFWYPFALSQSPLDTSTVGVVPSLSVQAEALLAISRLERQIALLTQTFLPGGATPPIEAPVLAAPMTPVVTPVAAPVVTPAEATAPSLLSTVEASGAAIGGFESFDNALSQGDLL